MGKPLLFIGSSSESKQLATALQEGLSDTLDVMLWTQMTGTLSQQVLEALEGELEAADFAAFIFAPDDDIAIRGEQTKSVRDNVLLELGVSRGMLGRRRTYIVRPTEASAELRTATDLAGVLAASYNATEAHGTQEQCKRALLSAANEIRATAGPLSFRPRATPPKERRVQGVLDRGSTEALEDLADAAIYVTDKRENYFGELRRFITGSDIVPSKYLYWTPQGSSHWLEFCRLKRYRFYRDSLKVLQAHADAIVDAIVAATGTAQVDFVSVGSGNGEKDNILLQHLRSKLVDGEFIYYYPVDISDMLIVEAVRNALGKGLRRNRGQFRVKALVADFIKLEKLQAFYEDRANPNVFSVLGNTVGNADEEALMTSVADAMIEGDLVLMEVNVGAPDVADPIWREKVTLEHDFTPLTIFNVPLEPTFMKYSLITDTSSVPDAKSSVAGTKSILASYDEAVIGASSYKDIKLSVVHYYDSAQFLKHMAQRLNVRVLWSIPQAEDDVYLVLARRE